MDPPDVKENDDDDAGGVGIYDDAVDDRNKHLFGKT